MQPPPQHDTRADYFRFLAEYRLTEKFTQAISENLADQIAMPAGFDKLRVQSSPIHGTGTFATDQVVAGELLGPARISGKRTPAGRFTNHSPYQNAKFVALPNGDLDMVSLHAIELDAEVSIDYRQAGAVNGWSLVPDRQIDITDLA